MFEKEAEEIANKRCHEIMCYGHCSFSSPKHHRCGEWHREYECALKGAEFGYNKANEWHYPSKGEYPKEDKRYLCKIKAFVGGGIDYECFDYDIEYGSWKNAIGEIIAWKEIVLPELKG